MSNFDPFAKHTKITLNVSDSRMSTLQLALHGYARMFEKALRSDDLEEYQRDFFQSNVDEANALLNEIEFQLWRSPGTPRTPWGEGGAE